MDRFKDTDYSRTLDITVKEVRACPEFAHFTDEQAEEFIATLKIFTKIIYDYYKKEQQKL